jgi:hypothetical protein
VVGRGGISFLKIDITNFWGLQKSLIRWKSAVLKGLIYFEITG